MLYHFLKTVTLLAFFLTTTAPSLKAMEDLVDKPARDSDTTKSLTESEEGETTDRLNSNTNEYAVPPSGEDDTFIKPGNLERLLSAVKYSGCPECSFNHPLIQGVLVYEAQHSEDFLTKARAFYLLHIVLDNKRVQTQVAAEKDNFENLRNKALAKSRDLFSVVSTENFDTQKEQWRKSYVFVGKDEREKIKPLTRLKNEQKWSEFKRQYDALSTPYISETILLAKAAFLKQIDSDAEAYIKLASSEYYAEGFLKMGDFLTTRSYSISPEEQLSYIEQAKEFYKIALIDYNDIRGYEYFTSIGGVPDEEMDRKKLALKSKQDDLQNTLISLLK